MLPASNKGPSLSFGFPDVCLTPVGPVIVPIPYPNFAAHAMASVFSLVVKAGMLPALNLASIIAMTTGDEPGVAHPTIMGIGTFTVGNPVVFIEGLPGIMLTAQTMGNAMNCPTGAVIAPGAPNVLYTLLPGSSAEGEEGECDEREGESATEEGAKGHLPGPVDGGVDPRLSGSPLAGEPCLLPGGVGVVRVRIFSLALPGALHLALQRLAALGMRSLVLDLRGCPGGELGALVEVASDFLSPGLEIATLRDAEGDETPYLARGGGSPSLPLFFAVDRATASAAELFAGALQAHGRAVVVGERTFGKAAAQALTPGAAGAGPQLATTAEVLLPRGISIAGRGLAPDVPCAAADAQARAVALARAMTPPAMAPGAMAPPAMAAPAMALPAIAPPPAPTLPAMIRDPGRPS